MILSLYLTFDLASFRVYLMIHPILSVWRINSPRGKVTGGSPLRRFAGISILDVMFFTATFLNGEQ